MEENKKIKNKIITILFNVDNKRVCLSEVQNKIDQLTGNSSHSSDILNNLKEEKIINLIIHKFPGGAYNIQLMDSCCLTLEGKKIAEYLQKPLWHRFYIDIRRKNINWTKWGVILSAMLVGIGLILNALSNLDRIESNFNKYFKNNNIKTIKKIDTKTNKASNAPKKQVTPNNL